MAEVIAIVAHIWAKGHRVRPIFKSEFNKTKIVKWAFSRVGGIPVARGTADLKSLRYAQHALQRGEDILIFPEGTRIRTGGCTWWLCHHCKHGQGNHLPDGCMRIQGFDSQRLKDYEAAQVLDEGGRKAKL